MVLVQDVVVARKVEIVHVITGRELVLGDGVKDRLSVTG
jgi:hypothetical protein